MKSILFIHQSSELYGSDKTLLILVQALHAKGFKIHVVLPGEGPLADELRQENITVIVAPVLKMSRKMFTPGNLLSLPGQMRRAVKLIDQATAGTGIELVYSNTLAVLIGLVYAWKKKLKHIWHVHEIIGHPAFVRRIYTWFLKRKVNTRLIFNSQATGNFWQAAHKNNAAVIWNGLTGPPSEITPAEKKHIRGLAGAGDNDIVIALIGRINRLKGQQLLLQAFNNLSLRHTSLKLLFVGSAPPGQDIYLERLENKVKEYGLTDRVTILPYQQNIWAIWQSIDIATAPSTEPESFGLVALEAMLCKKPVVASNLGGLSEIVVDQETGLLFKPGDEQALESALESLILNTQTRINMGIRGYERAIAHFTQEKYTSGIEKLCMEV